MDNFKTGGSIKPAGGARPNFSAADTPALGEEVSKEELEKMKRDAEKAKIGGEQKESSGWGAKGGAGPPKFSSGKGGNKNRFGDFSSKADTTTSKSSGPPMFGNSSGPPKFGGGKGGNMPKWHEEQKAKALELEKKIEEAKKAEEERRAQRNDRVQKAGWSKGGDDGPKADVKTTTLQDDDEAKVESWDGPKKVEESKPSLTGNRFVNN